MNDSLDYRPKTIEFEIETDGTNMPLTFGEFKTLSECMKTVHSNMTAIGQGVTVNRHMDSFEKKGLRERYNDVLENQLPRLEKEHSIATQELSEAKRKEKDAHERVNAAITEAKILAKEVKIGLVSLNLDDTSTVRIPYQGRYYFYTFMDGEFKLCKILDINEQEKQELWTAQASNEQFIDENFGDATTEA